VWGRGELPEPREGGGGRGQSVFAGIHKNPQLGFPGLVKKPSKERGEQKNIPIMRLRGAVAHEEKGEEGILVINQTRRSR